MIGLNLWLQRLEHEEGVGQHHQGHMTMQAIQDSPLIVIQATFALGILLELLDRPAQTRQFNQARQESVCRQGTEKPFRIAFLSRQRTLPKQDAGGRYLTL